MPQRRPGHPPIAEAEVLVVDVKGRLQRCKLEGVQTEGRLADAVLARRIADTIGRRSGPLPAGLERGFAQPSSVAALEEAAARHAWLSPDLAAMAGALRADRALTLPQSARVHATTEDGHLRIWSAIGEHRHILIAKGRAPDGAWTPTAPVLRLPAATAIRAEGIVGLFDAHIDVVENRGSRGRLARALTWFREGLDRRALDALRAAGVETHAEDTYNWLVADGDARRSTTRRQALEAYPAVVPFRVRKPDLVAHIDAGHPLEPALAASLETSPAALRSIQPVRQADMGDVIAIDVALKAAGRLPPGHVPTRGDATAWRSFAIYASHVNRLNESFLRLPGPLLNAPAADLAHDRPFWNGPAAEAKTRQFAQGHVGILDMAEFFGQQVLLPILADAARDRVPDANQLVRLLNAPLRRDGPSVTGLVLVRDRTPFRLLALSDQWHKADARIRASIIKASDSRSWEPLCRPVTIPTEVGPLVVRPLTTAAELAQESLDLGHCVANYVPHCLYEGCHVLSVRTPEGKALSTFEIREHEGRPHLVQHEGAEIAPDDRTPPPAARAAMEGWMARARDGALAIDWERLRAGALERQGEPDAVSSYVGYPVESVAGRDAALAAWSFVLPEEERGLSHAAWARRLALPEAMRALVDQPSPVRQPAPRLQGREL